MKHIFIAINLIIIFLASPPPTHSQNFPVWEDSTALINGINIIINDDSLCSNLKLNLIYKFLEKNKPNELSNTDTDNKLTNATNNYDLQSSKKDLQKNSKENEVKIRNKCQAKTKSGSKCQRNAKVGSKYCWQHSN
jgi:hypothetical protein